MFRENERMIKIAETNEFFKESFKKEKNGVMRAARFNSLASNVISFLSQSLWLFMSLSQGKTTYELLCYNWKDINTCAKFLCLLNFPYSKTSIRRTLSL